MRVLIVRVGALGDVLHAMPAVAALRNARPDWTIDWVVDQRWRPLLAGDRSPIVNGTYAVDTRAWKQSPLSRSTLASFFQFRHLQPSYDLVVDMQGTLRSAAIGWLAGRGRLAGYRDPRESGAAHLYSRQIERRGVHVVDQGAALLGEASGIALEPAPAELAWDTRVEELTAWRADLERPQALLAPGGGWGAKQWSAQRYGEVALALRERGYSVLVNAASATSAEALAVLDASRGAARIAAGSIPELIALMRRTDLFVGGDTGPTHLAAALAVPTLALFGPTSPERNGPWGPGPKVVLRDAASPTTYKRSDASDPGLDRITVEQVMAAVDAICG